MLPPADAAPLDVFMTASSDPATIVGDFARITGRAELPPLWSFGSCSRIARWQAPTRCSASHERSGRRFRAHGRTWHLRLPWGWNTGGLGHEEVRGYTGGAGHPDPSELRNAAVEPIVKKYVELRYRLLPYTYTLAKETTETGLPMMRALWLHYPDDPAAVARGDQFLWGRDLLVSPVVEKGAASRRLYLPRGTWFDFCSEARVEGGREIDRAVDLETMPLHVEPVRCCRLGR